MGFFGELDPANPTTWWDGVVDAAVAAEGAGFAAIYTCDHLIADEGRTNPFLECFTTLAALSQRTNRVRLGQLVSAAAFRNPALLARMIATLDVVSGGRAELGLGSGWFAGEFEAYGYTFLPPGERVRQLDEALTVIRSLWSEDVTTFHGEHVHVVEARCDPKPLQAHVPILVGAFRRKSLRVLARHGDRCNFQGTPEQYARRLRYLEEACAAEDRDLATVERTWLCNGALVGRDEREVERLRAAAATEGNKGGALIDLCGTPAQVVERLEEYAALGVSEVTMRFADHPHPASFELFAAEVMPHFV